MRCKHEVRPKWTNTTQEQENFTASHEKYLPNKKYMPWYSAVKKSFLLVTAIATLLAGCSTPDNYYYKGEVLQTIPLAEDAEELGITRDYNAMTGCEQELKINDVGCKVSGSDDGAIIAVMPDSLWYADPSEATIAAMGVVIGKLKEMDFKVTDKKVTIFLGKVMNCVIYSEPGAYDALVTATRAKD